MGAQANGAESARVIVPAILARMRRETHLIRTVADVIEASIEAGTVILRQAEMTEAQVAAWRLGFIRAANPLVQGFMIEMDRALSDISGHA